MIQELYMLKEDFHIYTNYVEWYNNIQSYLNYSLNESRAVLALKF
jgi:hypothetical protein